MQVDRRMLDVRMSEQQLDRAKIGAEFQKMSSK
jgi:hypothetical protein